MSPHRFVYLPHTTAKPLKRSEMATYHVAIAMIMIERQLSYYKDDLSRRAIYEGYGRMLGEALGHEIRGGIYDRA